MKELQLLCHEKEKGADERNEFLFDFSDRPDTFFGANLRERRLLCSRIHNYCVFSHHIDKCRCDHGVNPWLQCTETDPCIFHHDVGKCQCNRVAMTIGQDESVFHAYILGLCVDTTTIIITTVTITTTVPLRSFIPLLSPTQLCLTGNKTWYVQNKVGLRKKSNGPGCHVSAFVGYALGFGVKVLDACGVLKRANQKREGTTSAVDDSPKVKLVCNPAIRYVCVCVDGVCGWAGVDR